MANESLAPWTITQSSSCDRFSCLLRATQASRRFCCIKGVPFYLLKADKNTSARMIGIDRCPFVGLRIRLILKVGSNLIK